LKDSTEFLTLLISTARPTLQIIGLHTMVVFKVAGSVSKAREDQRNTDRKPKTSESGYTTISHLAWNRKGEGRERYVLGRVSS
jgi:hypothetical protein